MDLLFDFDDSVTPEKTNGVHIPVDGSSLFRGSSFNNGSGSKPDTTITNLKSNSQIIKKVNEDVMANIVLAKALHRLNNGVITSENKHILKKLIVKGKTKTEAYKIKNALQHALNGDSKQLNDILISAHGLTRAESIRTEHTMNLTRSTWSLGDDFSIASGPSSASMLGTNNMPERKNLNGSNLNTMNFNKNINAPKSHIADDRTITSMVDDTENDQDEVGSVFTSVTSFNRNAAKENQGNNTPVNSDMSERPESVALRPPHPRAGGFMKSLPHVLHMVHGSLVGHTMVRISSKRAFRKWKVMFFALSKNHLCFYDTLSCWEGGRDPKIDIRMHGLMFICKPTLKLTRSTMDVYDPHRKLYYAVLRENYNVEAAGYSAEPVLPYSHGENEPLSTHEVSTHHDPGAGSALMKYSPQLENRRLIKFGGYSYDEVLALAYAIHGVIQEKAKFRRELEEVRLQARNYFR